MRVIAVSNPAAATEFGSLRSCLSRRDHRRKRHSPQQFE
jgi:hypothetical protein